MDEKFLKKLSGIDNLLSIFKCRVIIGSIFVVYGLLVLFVSMDIWIKISIMLAFFGLGMMFILDGQSILRQYFNNKNREKENTIFKTKEKINDTKYNFKINLLGTYLSLILLFFILIGILTYTYKFSNKLIFSLIIIACSGGIGGTIYSIRGFYKNLGEGTFSFDNWVWWYIFRPIVSAVIGIFVYFLIIGGLLIIGNLTEVNYSKGLIFYSALAFLAGFSFTQFANKLEEIASTIFTKKEDKKR